jgi:hypothetical protein
MKIHATNLCGDTKVRVNQKNIRFVYTAPKSAKNIKAKKGRSLSIHIGDWFDSTGYITVNLDGTQINTLKKILKAAGEI